jgi:hypothetical protein
LPANPASRPVAPPSATSSLDLDAIYREIKRRAAADTGVLALLSHQPELHGVVSARAQRLAGYPSPGAMSLPMGTKS